MSGTTIKNSAAPAGKAASKNELSIALYNIRYGTGAGVSHHMPFPFAGALRSSTKCFEKMASWLESVSPDIVCLVESDMGGYRSSNASQGELLAGRLGGYVSERCKYGKTSVLSRLPLFSGQGNSVVSKRPPSNVSYRFFDRGVKRLFIDAEWDDLRLVLVHLALGRATRSFQIRTLAGVVGESKGKPTVVAGDGNIFGGDEELAPLRNAGMRRVDTGPTWPSVRPRHPLDFLMVSENIGEVEAYVPDVPWSDHLPVLCSLKTG